MQNNDGNTREMLRIGLTGGIASGKSTAAIRFAELGARVVDHDVLARKAVEPGTSALSDIVGVFGDRVVTNGELDRAALAAVVFSNDYYRQKLNQIVHPYVVAMGIAADRQARTDGVRVIVHDIPLLVETGQAGDFDLVVTVAAPLETRVERLINSRGMTRDHALARITSQTTDEQREGLSDVVLDGGGTVDALRVQVDEFWNQYIPTPNPGTA